MIVVFFPGELPKDIGSYCLGNDIFVKEFTYTACITFRRNTPVTIFLDYGLSQHYKHIPVKIIAPYGYSSELLFLNRNEDILTTVAINIFNYVHVTHPKKIRFDTEFSYTDRKPVKWLRSGEEKQKIKP